MWTITTSLSPLPPPRCFHGLLPLETRAGTGNTAEAVADGKSLGLNLAQFLFSINFLSQSNVLSTNESELFKLNQLESIRHHISFYQVIKTNVSYQYCVLAKARGEEEIKLSTTLTRNSVKWRTESEQDFFP